MTRLSPIFPTSLQMPQIHFKCLNMVITLDLFLKYGMGNFAFVAQTLHIA